MRDTSLKYKMAVMDANSLSFIPQNASAGVSRMLLANKCDIEAKRKVSKETGEKVSLYNFYDHCFDYEVFSFNDIDSDVQMLVMDEWMCGSLRAKSSDFST